MHVPGDLGSELATFPPTERQVAPLWSGASLDALHRALLTVK